MYSAHKKYSIFNVAQFIITVILMLYSMDYAYNTRYVKFSSLACSFQSGMFYGLTIIVTHTVTIYEIKLTHIIGFVSASAFLHFYTHRKGIRLRYTLRVNLMSPKPVCVCVRLTMK